MISQSIIALYIVIFVYECIDTRQINWLLGSVLLWAFYGLMRLQLLGEWASMSDAIGWYQPYAFITLASVFFFVNHWKWQKKVQLFCANPRSGHYLSYLAISGLAMHLMFFFITLLAWMDFPNRAGAYFLVQLSQLYLFQPVYWIVCQWLLMFIMFLVKRHFYKTRLVVMSQSECLFALFYAFVMIIYSGKVL